MNVDDLAENLGLKKDEYLELLELLIQTSKVDIAKIESALREENPDDAASALHSIKGAAGNLGLMEISNLAKQGESAARDNALNRIPNILHGLTTQLDSLAQLAGI